jgi:putative DNA primase/helicase
MNTTPTVNHPSTSLTPSLNPTTTQRTPITEGQISDRMAGTHSHPPHTCTSEYRDNPNPTPEVNDAEAPQPALPTDPIRHTTQLGNSERMVFRYRNQIRYCHTWKKWLIWNGRRWKPDNRQDIYGLAKDTVRSIYSEAARMEEEASRSRLVDHAVKSESLYEIKAMIEMAQNDLAISPEDLDKNPMLFNCQNGTLDLSTGKLRRHNQADCLSKMSPVVYDAEGQCPNWVRFLERLFNGEDSLINFLQQAIGYTLTGKVTEKALFVFVGDGDNGKTTLLEAVRFMMGDYAGTVEINHLMQSASGAEQQRAIADLHGRRFITASEAEEGQKLNVAKIKQITGMGRLTGCRIYGSAFEFDPLFKLFIDANHKPVIRGSDLAIWNRIRLVPFNVSIPKAKQDRHLLSKLKDEAPGILAWAVRGCLEWQQHKHLVSPSAVSEAGENYRQEMDLVQDFVGDSCECDASATTLFTTLYSRYQHWCEQIREQPISTTAFGKWLEGHGFRAVRKSGARMRQGLRLKPEPVTVTVAA